MVKSVQASVTVAAYERLRTTLERERQTAEELQQTVLDAREDDPAAAAPATGGRGKVIDLLA